MGIRARTKHFHGQRRHEEGGEPQPLELIGEEPFLIRVDDRPYAVVMRTPGEERAHAAGFCLAEGILQGLDDVERFGFDAAADPNVVDVWLRPERRDKILDRLERRFFVSQTSCGICGKEVVQDLCQNLVRSPHEFTLDLPHALGCYDRLCGTQQHYQTTRGSHAAMLLDGELRELAFAEDVGRHNALDKAIGQALLGGTLGSARVAVLSSRISYELVQKAARGLIPVMISGSRPTSLAVEMGTALEMTLAYPDGDGELVIACGPERVEA